MTETVSTETMGFQAEIKQLLKLMINSLYSNQEIFLRELVSNASDALDKLRFAAIAQPDLYGDDSNLNIRILVDKEQGTLTVRDNGIGMTRDDIVEQLGTIAKSGTREFLDKLSGEQAKDQNLIGQFGVGFYASFIVADKVTVESRCADGAANEAVRWESAGEGEFTVTPIEKATRGTDVILHLRDDAKEFLEDFRLRSIISKYSDHIAFPVLMKKPAEGEEVASDEFETVNKAKALWAQPKRDLKAEDYSEFYKHISHDFDDPMSWAHNRVEGTLEYISLLYLPKRAPFDLWQRDAKHGLKLFVQRVFIMDDVEQFLPLYLRFIRGVIDSNDLPLNVSREILQSDTVVEKIKSGITNRVLDMLEKLASDEPENYQAFWNEFGRVLKEGPSEDYANRERIAKLLRFASTNTDTDIQNVSFEDYISRLQDGQDKIYYVTAESFTAAKNSPHLEIFRKKGLEVLLLSDPVDEWLVGHLTEFEGKQLVSVAKGDLDLGDVDDDKSEEDKKAVENEFESLISKAKEVLGERVQDVRITYRLTSSPACVVAGEHDLGRHMQRILEAAGQQFSGGKPILELNPEHPLVVKLKAETNDQRFNEWTELLFEQAILAEGGRLEDPGTFVKRLNQVILELAE